MIMSDVKRHMVTIAVDRPDIAKNCSIMGGPAQCTTYENTVVVSASDYDAALAREAELLAMLNEATQLIHRIVSNLDTEINYYEDVEPNDLEHDQVISDMRAFLTTITTV
jgi:hypothetical protein